MDNDERQKHLNEKMLNFGRMYGASESTIEMITTKRAALRQVLLLFVKTITSHETALITKVEEYLPIIEEIYAPKTCVWKTKVWRKGRVFFDPHFDAPRYKKYNFCPFCGGAIVTEDY